MLALSGSTKNHFDVIVIGVGSMGAAACYYLAKQGAAVLGLEQFSIPNDLSSHTGQSRLIRKAYYEHADYVPLLQRAYHNWKELEAISGQKVYYETGLLYAGSNTHPVMQGVRAAAGQYNIPLYHDVNAHLSGHYAAFSLPDSANVILEPEAGFLVPGKAIALYAEQAIACGATIQANTIVESWKQAGNRVEVLAGGNTFYADKLVITAGPWAKYLLPSLSGLLTVTRQTLGWVEVNNPEAFMLGNMPCWVIAPEDVRGIYYGFPQLPAPGFDGPVGFKLAHHVAGSVTTPGTIDRTITATDINVFVGIMERCFPGAFKSMVAVKTCMYTNTPDEHFIIDQLPGYDRVVVAAGFSGHGFKFASAVGEILCGLVSNNQTGLPTGFLNAGRFLRR